MAVDSLRVLISTLRTPCVLLGFFYFAFPRSLAWADLLSGGTSFGLFLKPPPSPFPIFYAPLFLPDNTIILLGHVPEPPRKLQTTYHPQPHGSLDIPTPAQRLLSPDRRLKNPSVFTVPIFWSVGWVACACVRCWRSSFFLSPGLFWFLPTSAFSVLQFDIFLKVSHLLLLFFSRLRPKLDKAMPHGWIWRRIFLLLSSSPHRFFPLKSFFYFGGNLSWALSHLRGHHFMGKAICALGQIFSPMFFVP